MDPHASAPLLICRVQTRLCALPMQYVIEIMRPLPVEAIAGAPPFVRGLSRLRGEQVPVVDAARLICHADSQPARFVSLVVGERRVVLAVDHVLGVRSVSADTLRALPPLLGNARADYVDSIGLLDEQLLLMLRAARLLPELDLISEEQS